MLASRRRPALVLALALAATLALPAGPAEAGRTTTPEATRILTFSDDDAQLALGFAAPLPGASDRIGLVVQCHRATQGLRAALYFGAFPDGKPVQAAVRDTAGNIARFGPVLKGSRRSGFHDPEVDKRDDVLRLTAMAFSQGALLSNGHNSVWNRISEGDNRDARRRLLDCAGESG